MRVPCTRGIVLFGNTVVFPVDTRYHNITTGKLTKGCGRVSLNAQIKQLFIV